MTSNAPVRLGHVAPVAARPDRLAPFYRDLLALHIVRRDAKPLARTPARH